ncbi:SMC family ATPase [Synechococcus sp. PCC 6717]|nr:SMC family ATPase [Synechococcus sp. PCC 6717]
MEIQRLTLTNFKTHRDRTVNFCRGVNVICGENGAGKTSLLEAIAWVLFDATSGYGSGFNKAIIRKGATHAEATVQFISAADGRSYLVKRSTRSGYSIFDPQLQALVLSRRDEVQQWLKEHLGINSALPLKDLFEQVIGIPQGMMTADFFGTAAQRRAIFEPILQVDDYRRAYDAALALEKHSETRLQHLRETIARHEQALASREDYTTKAQALAAELAQDYQQRDRLAQVCHALAQERAQLEAEVAALEHLAQQQQRLQHQLEQQEQLCRDRHQQLAAAQLSQARCQDSQATYDRYRELQQALRSLERQLKEQGTLEQQIAECEQRQQRAATKLAHLEAQRQAIATIESQLAALAPQIAAADALEQELAVVHAQLRAAEQAAQEATHLEEQIQSAQLRLVELEQQLAALDAQRPLAATLNQKQQERDRLAAQISHLSAAQAFAATLAPIVASATTQAAAIAPLTRQAIHELTAAQDFALLTPAVTLGLQALQHLHANHQQLLNDLEALLKRLDPSEQDLLTPLLAQLDADIAAAAAAERSLLQWHPLAAEKARLHEHLSALGDRQRQLIPRYSQLAQLQRQYTKLSTKLEALGQPRAQQQVLLEQQQSAPDIETAVQELVQHQAQLNSELAPLYRQRQYYQALEQKRQALTEELATLEHAYQTYLQHQHQASQVAAYQAALAEAQATYAALQNTCATLAQDYQTQAQRIDVDRLREVTARHEQLSREYQTLLGAIPEKERQYQHYADALQHLEAVAQQLARSRQTLAEYQQRHHFIVTAREIYRTSGPRVSEAYLHSISHEADRLFRELLNRPDVALRWLSDYDIQVNEGGHWRSFRSLSGGEQMCAALAVRLALLRILAATDVAFFDEPTTNMDHERRQQLAENLANLRSFRQLFVISHDETFAALTEHIIHLERQAP